MRRAGWGESENENEMVVEDEIGLVVWSVISL
jgi:hypothetical protein